MKKKIFTFIFLFLIFCKSIYAQKIFLFLNGTNYYSNVGEIKNNFFNYDLKTGEINIYIEIPNHDDSTLIEKVKLNIKDKIFQNNVVNSTIEFDKKNATIVVAYHDNFKNEILFDTDAINSEKIIGKFHRIDFNTKTISFDFFIKNEQFIFEGSFDNILIKDKK